jgi:hypothetical protein
MYLEIGLIAFGWLLGLLGSVITDSVRDWRRGCRLKKLVNYELCDLKIRLVMIYYLLGTKRGRISSEGFEWYNTRLLSYKGTVIDTELREMSAKVVGLRGEALTKALEALVQPEKTRTSVKKYAIPALRAQLNALVYLKPEIARELAEIVNQLDEYDQLVDQHRMFFEKTFDPGIRLENAEICSKNLNETESMLISFAKDLAERIERVGETVLH